MWRRSLTVLVVLVAGAAPVVSGAQTAALLGMVVDVDQGRRTIVLETRAGQRAVSISAEAAIRDDHGQRLTLHDVRPGDAVVHRMRADGVAELGVVRQFWAIPADQ